MSVALGLVPQRALLNDINCHLINFYRWLQRGLVIGIELKYDQAVYYRRRKRFNELVRQGLTASQEAAELFYYLNRTGYNGLCRFNKRGLFNVPFGQHKTIHYRADMQPYAPVLSRWEFTHTDFAQVQLHPEDMVYADPPYDVEFTSYSAGGFGWDDQVRLAEWLARHPGPVIASNQATERIQRLYGRLGFVLTFLDAPRRISNNGDRTPVQEVLATRHL
jgi:DNA adenine methylase